MGLVSTSVLSFGGLKSLVAQQSTSNTSDPVKELVENMRSVTSEEATTEPSMVWQYGEAADAQTYSNKHDVIAFVCSIGENSPYTDEQIVNAIDQNVFTGDIEAPIAIFISPEKMKGKEGSVFEAYIRGQSYRDDYTGEKYLSAQELVDTAPQMVNKFKNYSRAIDKEAILLPENNH